MNKTLKIMLVALMVLTLVVIPTMSAASDIVAGMTGEATLQGNAEQKITDMTNVIVRAIRYIGAGVSVIMLAVLGIMYLLGSAEQKAEYKKSFIPYIVGIVLLFAATQIAGFIIGAAESLN